MSKSVAVIGAGPAGIIAARKLLQCGQFTVTIFEKGDCIGGSWVPNGIINPNMRTNQSKFTMSFSDLSWESLGSSPVYPKAADVYLYLEEYVKRYIPVRNIRFRTAVVKVEQIPEASVAGGNRWKLQLHETIADGDSHEYNPPPSFTVGLVTPEKVKASRKMIRSIIDGDEGYVDTRRIDELAPIGILGDSYPQFVKTGRILHVRGTLSRLKQVDEEYATAIIQNVKKDDYFGVDSVCAVIQATGFDTASSLDLLSSQIKTALDHDPTCSPAPFILDTKFLSQNLSLPTLGIVGYPGAYWPLFEMQARAIVNAWTSSSSLKLTNTPSDVGQRSKLRRYYTDLRRAFKEGRKAEVPHNPFGDSLGLLEQASRELDLERFDLGSSEAEGFVCSARYTEPGSDKTEAMKTLMEVQRVQRRGRQGSFLARAVARGLMGKWIAAELSSNGEFEVVQRSFHPMYPTDEAFDWEYLMVGKGDEKTVRKVYRYSEATDCITVWNVAEDGSNTGTQMATFDFKHAQQEHGKHTAVTVLAPLHSQGGSVDKMAVFRFHFAGSLLKTWTMRWPGSPYWIAELNFVRAGLRQWH
ncbi:hypothetical protein SLS60_003850 [Paraconiothyrium brasiliense]|uniref:Flavin-containing monooxygenase n=1 Tax=Paraconiothyrium brasiliense TaxID=300254 RepID=A0ABR3RPT7_9PLEO